MQRTQNNTPHGNSPDDAEAGYLLVGMIVLCALILIALAVAAPVVARDLRRDKEVESQHRAEQYTRAIRLYYRKNKSYPPSMEALEKSNNIRFLRQKYVDPLTGKSDWKLIHVGQNQTTVKGFFGKPLAGIASSGLGSAAGLQSGGSTAPTSTTGTSINTGCSGANSAFCNQAPTTSTSGGAGGTTATGAGATPSTGSEPATTSLDALSGGGGAIMGVGTAAAGDSVTEPNEQTTYDTWEFLYDPRIELLYNSAKITGGGGFGSSAASSFGKDATSDNPTGSSGSSTNPGTGSSSPGVTPGNVGPGNTPGNVTPNGN